MRFFSLSKQVLIAVVLSLSISPCLSISSSNSHVAKTSSSKEKALPANRSEWLTHATLSYQQWQQGNIVSALREGEEAVRLNPGSSVARINLALIKQRAKDYDGAMSLYWQAAKLLPNSWVPPLGIARCYILSNDEGNSREILDMMSEMNNRDFNWYYMTAKTWLEIDNL